MNETFPERAVPTRSPVIGLIGAGSIANALARGWELPFICTDGGSGRAAALAAKLGGSAVATSFAVGELADVVILCHPPEHLDTVAADLADTSKPVVSIAAGVTLDRLAAVLPSTPVFRFGVTLSAGVRRGVILYGGCRRASSEQEERVVGVLARLGTVVQLEEHLLSPALAVVNPALLALLVEAQTDAAIGHGVPASVATQLITHSLEGVAALLRGGVDTLTVRREVATPAGPTSQLLATLERRSFRTAVIAAFDAHVARQQDHAGAGAGAAERQQD